MKVLTYKGVPVALIELLPGSPLSEMQICDWLSPHEGGASITELLGVSVPPVLPDEPELKYKLDYNWKDAINVLLSADSYTADGVVEVVGEATDAEVIELITKEAREINDEFGNRGLSFNPQMVSNKPITEGYEEEHPDLDAPSKLGWVPDAVLEYLGKHPGTRKFFITGFMEA